MFNKTKFKEFLISPEITSFTYIDTEYSSKSNHYYKEKFNHRFYLLYEKDYESNSMNDNDYKFAGYFDCIDRIIYNPSYDIRTNILENSDVCNYSYFSVLSEQIKQGVSDNLREYSAWNKDNLKNISKEKFTNQTDYMFDSYKKSVEKEFISSELLEQISLPDYNASYKYEHKFTFSNNLIYTEYLDQPKDTINKICDKVLEIEEVQEDLGEMILKNEFQNNYLKEILENKDNTFSHLYINKAILNSIKDIDAVNFNITISYDNEKLTFKFPKNRLVNELEDASVDADDYCKSYEIVEEFLKKHKHSKDNYHSDSFDFSNITSISYGKNVLYENDFCTSKSIEVKEDLDEREI